MAVMGQNAKTREPFANQGLNERLPT
jgi:hypothetical protein